MEVVGTGVEGGGEGEGLDGGGVEGGLAAFGDLEAAAAEEKSFGGDGEAVLLEGVAGDEEVGDAGFVFEGNETVAFGGAGPMAAVFLAEELDIHEVLIPRFPGTFSAWGMLQTNLRHDLTQSFFQPAQDSVYDDIIATFTALGYETTLLVDDDVRMAGGIEPTAAMLTTETEGTYAATGGAIEAVGDLVEHMLDKAMAQGASLELVRSEPAKAALRKHGPAAAILRF